MLIPGIVSATFKELSIDDVLKITEDTDLKAIEWSENHHIKLGNLEQARTTYQKTKDLGLEIASYGSYFRLGKEMDFLPSLKNAVAMNAPFIRIWAGDKPSASVGSDEYKKIVEEAKLISRMAEDEAIVVSLEWHRNTLTDRNESALKFLEDVDSPFFRTFWQPSPEMDVVTRCKGLEMVSRYIENIHVYYWDESGRRPLKEGQEDWKSYMKLFDDRKHYALLEFVKDNSVEQFKEDSEIFLKWIKGVWNNG